MPKAARSPKPLSPGAYVDKMMAARASIETEAEAAAETARARVRGKHEKRTTALLARVPDAQKKQAEAMLAAALAASR